MDESNFSCSRLDRIVIGGGGGPANIVDPLRNCYNELFCGSSGLNLGGGFTHFRFYLYMYQQKTLYQTLAILELLGGTGVNVAGWLFLLQLACTGGAAEYLFGGGGGR